MKRSNELLNHMERVQKDYVDAVDKMPTEDKLILSHEEALSDLEPWEISEIVQTALNDLPEGLEDHIDSLFDLVYDAISEALDRSRR